MRNRQWRPGKMPIFLTIEVSLVIRVASTGLKPPLKTISSSSRLRYLNSVRKNNPLIVLLLLLLNLFRPPTSLKIIIRIIILSTWRVIILIVRFVAVTSVLLRLGVVKIFRVDRYNVEKYRLSAGRAV